MPETCNGVFPAGPPLWRGEGGERRLLEHDCPRFMAEDCRKGRLMQPRRSGRHENQGESVTVRGR